MNDRYEPKSDFLKAVIGGDVPLTGNMFAEANLKRLIAMIDDVDDSNRDWAVFLLAQTELDTVAIRNAFRGAAGDASENVRAEAIWGLARIAPEEALPLVKGALASGAAIAPIVEAAALIAHPSLSSDLAAIANATTDEFIAALAKEALAACVSGMPKDI